MAPTSYVDVTSNSNCGHPFFHQHGFIYMLGFFFWAYGWTPLSFSLEVRDTHVACSGHQVEMN